MSAVWPARWRPTLSAPSRRLAASVRRCRSARWRSSSLLSLGFGSPKRAAATSPERRASPGGSRVLTVMALAVLSAAASGCLVLSLAPLYDSESMGWDARLIGSWIDEDDHASMEIGRAEWQS